MYIQKICSIWKFSNEKCNKFIEKIKETRIFKISFQNFKGISIDLQEYNYCVKRIFIYFSNYWSTQVGHSFPVDYVKYN